MLWIGPLRDKPHGGCRSAEPRYFRLKATAACQAVKIKMKESMIKRIFLLLVASASLVLSTIGCHTVHGAGEDIESAGQKIQNNTPP